MPYLLSCQELSKSFGAQTLFTSVNLVVAKGERIGLIGPNGSGKSTLLKILCNLVEPDSGKIYRQKHVRLSYLDQQDIFNEDETVRDNLYTPLTTFGLDETEQFNRVNAILSRAEFAEPDSPVSLLSGGWRKRLAICRALVVHPDILVMDEPTNHLDIEGILWLEKLLQSSLPESPDAFIMVSHDRRFLENTVNRLVELSATYPEGTFEVKGNYSAFLEKREEFLKQQQQHEERLANKVRRETEWLRRGPKARATKAKYRKDEAYRLQDQLAQVKTRNRAGGNIDISFDTTHRKTKKLLTASGLTKGYHGRVLFADLDIVLSPGTRLGLLGNNGCGKSTLMQILADAATDSGHKPDSGTIKTAENVRIVSFDQRREQLDQEQTLRRALAPDGDAIVFQDRSIHVVSWAKRFLFRADQLETPVSRLSGGEQARILIASLMCKPADILLLDEPTNDLDIPSLNILEESLHDFPGALVLVTHDRFMLDRICDRVLGFNGKGQVAFYADYHQWLHDIQSSSCPEKKSPEPNRHPQQQKKNNTARLSYMDQREYDQIEEKLDKAEQQQQQLEQLMQHSETAAEPEKLNKCWQQLENVQQEIARLYARWEELENIKDGKV